MPRQLGEGYVTGAVKDSAARWPWAASREPASSRTSTLFELKNAPLRLPTSDATGRGKEIIDQEPLLWHPMGFSSAQYQPMTQHV